MTHMKKVLAQKTHESSHCYVRKHLSHFICARKEWEEMMNTELIFKYLSELKEINNREW